MYVKQHEFMHHGRSAKQRKSWPRASASQGPNERRLFAAELKELGDRRHAAVDGETMSACYARFGLGANPSKAASPFPPGGDCSS